MFETILVIAIVAVTAILVTRSFYRSTVARVRGCACKQECPLSDMCKSDSGECVEGLEAPDVISRKRVTN